MPNTTDSSFLVGGDELAPLYQAFTFNTYEVFTNYSYSVGASGQTTVVSAGVANVSTNPAAPGQATIEDFVASNTVSDSMGDYWSSSMSPPANGYPPPGPYFQSLDNVWLAWLTPGGTGQICGSIFYDADASGTGNFGCLSMSLP